MKFGGHMDERDFTGSQTGKLIWEINGMYFRFEPNPLPLTYKSDSNLERLLINTALALGKLEGLTHKFTPQEVRLMRTQFVLKEAMLSSKIEGTRSTLTDVYKEEKQKETDKEKSLDNEEIRNYAKALDFGFKHLNENITEDLIKEIHKILLTGVRGDNKQPGVYKPSQNAIGDREDTLETAKFVPASSESTPDLMKNLVDFINNEKNITPLYKVAIAHYQFETIHPFRDGNGRLGRLLIMLMLCKEDIIHQPLLYISEYFNRNRSTYTERLYGVSSKNEIELWLNFFLKALETQANESITLILKLETYKNELQEKIQSVSESSRMHLVVESIFKNPFITITDVSNELEISLPAASSLVHKLEGIEVLREITGKKTGKIFVAHKILAILEGKE